MMCLWASHEKILGNLVNCTLLHASYIVHSFQIILVDGYRNDNEVVYLISLSIIVTKNIYNLYGM